MSLVPPATFTIYPDDCDSYGHMNQAAFLRLFERARWEVLALGPARDAFSRSAAWPALRKASVEYYASAYPGDRLRCEETLTHHGGTSFSLHQTARHEADGTLAAAADFVFVCIGPNGRPVAVPEIIGQVFGTRPSVPAGLTHHFALRGITQAAEITGDGMPLVLIHGFPLDRTMWRHQVSALTGRWRITPDLRGLGVSGEAPGKYAMAEYADDLDALLDKLGVHRAVVCGLSMGGYVAFELWRRHRGRISALILANTRADPDSADGREGRNRMIRLAEHQGVGAVAEAMIPKLLGASSIRAMPRVVDHVRTMITDNPTGGVIGALGAMRDRPDSTPLLTAIDVPTLVIAGEDDAVIPLAASQAMADAIPGAGLATIPDAGHLTPLEQPIATTRVIAEFLDSL